MQPWIIETSGLTRRYGKLVPVEDLNLRVPAGSIFGFLGPNGAGKTTTIRMLLGLVHPTSGQINIDGHNLNDARLQILSRVGALVETPAFFSYLTATENLLYLCRLRGISSSAIAPVLKTVGLTDAAARKTGQYSLGMKQRLGIAAALVSQPRLLVLDEPTNGLDPNGIREVRDLIRALVREQDITVFLSSHLLSEVEQVASHVGIINRGHLLFQGSLAELAQQSRPSVRVAVDNPQKAAQILRTDFPDLSIDNTELDIPSTGDYAAFICRELVMNGINVNRLAPRQVTLETLFFNLTNAQPAPAAEYGD